MFSLSYRGSGWCLRCMRHAALYLPDSSQIAFQGQVILAPSLNKSKRPVEPNSKEPNLWSGFQLQVRRNYESQQIARNYSYSPAVLWTLELSVLFSRILRPSSLILSDTCTCCAKQRHMLDNSTRVPPYFPTAQHETVDPVDR